MTELIDIEAARKNRENIKQMRIKEAQKALKPKVSHHKRSEVKYVANRHTEFYH